MSSIDSNGIALYNPFFITMTMALAFSSNVSALENNTLESSFISTSKTHFTMPREYPDSNFQVSQTYLYQYPNKKSYKDRYNRIAKSKSFASAYHGMSVGEVSKIEE